MDSISQRLPRHKKSDPARPMGSPRQLLNLYLGEVYRYRLAMHDQAARIDIAKGELRRKPDSDVLARILDDNWGEKTRTMNEVQFFFVAVRGILGAANGIKDISANGAFPQVHKKVTEAISRFDGDAPCATDMRDFLSHMDAYLAGTGHKELPHPEHRVWLATPEDDFGLYVGGVAISISKTLVAGEELAQGLSQALSALEESEKRNEPHVPTSGSPRDNETS